MATLRIPSILLAVLVTSGCTAHLRPKVEIPTAKPEKLKLRAALVVPEAMEKKADDIGSFDGLGSYAVDTGETVLPALKDMLRDTFDVVDVVRKADLAPNADVILQVKVLKMVHPSGRSSDFQLRFDLRTTVTKQDGVQVIDASYNEFIEGQKKQGVQEALTSPTEKTIAATLEKFSKDLRASLGPPPVEAPPADAVAAAAGSGQDFSDFPPAPGQGEPAPTPTTPATDAPPPTPPPEPGATTTAAAPPPASDSTTAPPAAPPADAPAAAPAEPLVIAKPPPPPPKSGAGRAVMVTMGALLFAGGYVAPPVTMMLLNLPGGTNELAWIPIAGPLMASMTNPFLSQDTMTLVLTAAGTAGQVVGLALIVAGLASGGGGAPKQASLPFQGKGWALTPTITPGGIGVLLIH